MFERRFSRAIAAGLRFVLMLPNQYWYSGKVAAMERRCRAAYPVTRLPVGLFIGRTRL
jgi:hypothetical protein